VTLVIAHRGASAAFPENTVAAFEGAKAQGADWVELDVRRTADRCLVVAHDASLPGGALIVDTPRAEIDPSVPSLAEALDACEGMGVNIEIKNHPVDPDFDPSMYLAGEVVAEIQRRRAHDHVLVSCFDLDTVDAVRALDPTVPTAYLVLDPEGGAAIDLAVEHGHPALHPWAPMVDDALIRRAHDAGLLVNTWTVDDPDRIAELASWGIDGIVTNVPDIARAALDH
jgi:glycerophosphoryl diester phosphodiesterase